MNTISRAFSFDGRIGIGEYWVSLLIGAAVYSTLPMLNGLIRLPLSIALIVYHLAAGTKRCHDRGNPGLYMLIPFYALVMAFGVGDPGSNGYGLKSPVVSQNEVMNNPEIMNPRPRSIRIALWVGWLWFTLVFFNPGTLTNMGRNFFIWLPFALLFSIPLVLVAKGQNAGRIALNLILPVALAFGGFNLLRLLEVFTPMTFILFPFMVCFVWFPLLVVLICINRQSAREYFSPRPL